MTIFSLKSVDIQRKSGGFKRVSPSCLLVAGVLFLWLLGMSGCETAASKKRKAPQPLPGRSAKQAIQYRQSPDLFTSKNSVPTEKGAPPPPPVFAWPPGFVRVAALPIHTSAPTGDTLDALDEIFHSELSKLLPLEVVIVSRADLIAALGESQFASTDIIPQKLVQGVVFTDMPVYRPYRPIDIGVRSKLVQLPDMQILWSANGILDSGEPGIAASAVQFAERDLHGPGMGNAQLILQSPRRYAAFVANGLYGTLPGLPTAPVDSPSARR